MPFLKAATRADLTGATFRGGIGIAPVAPKPDVLPYPPQWDNQEPLHDPVTERYRQENTLQNLIHQGNRDAELYQSGGITPEEWYKRSGRLQVDILAAGYTLKEYVQAVNNYQPKTKAA